MTIVRSSMVFAMIITFMTTVLSAPFETLPGEKYLPMPEGVESLGPILPDPVGFGPHIPEDPMRRDGPPPHGPFRAEGFAQNSGEIYVLKISVVDTKQIHPSLARKFLKENRSLAEIKEEISKEEGSTVSRGGMSLGEVRYILSNINLTTEGNCTVLVADLKRFQFVEDEDDEIIGHIKIRTVEQDGAFIGKGYLTMFQGEHSKNYILELSHSNPSSPKAPDELEPPRPGSVPCPS